MARMLNIDVSAGDILPALQAFLKSVLAQETISALLVPLHLPMKDRVMPTLVSDPAKLAAADPLAPAFPLNAARLAARLTRHAAGGRIAAVLRPCEIRALVELVKLKQASTEDLLLIGIDCLGAFTNREFARYTAKTGAEATTAFYRRILSEDQRPPDDFDLAPACRVCEHPVAEGADIVIGLYGAAPGGPLWAEARTPKGEALLEKLGPAAAEAPVRREDALAELIAARSARRDEMFAATHRQTDSLEKLSAYLAACVNCYNCRVACPVCYCRECVFVTDVFDHEPFQYLKWAHRKGAVKMPTDTIFFHLTRLAHISTACVGCGQCSNACPNDIAVMELFRSVSHRTQAAFEYEAGRSLDEPPPLAVFKEDEFGEVTGL